MGSIWSLKQTIFVNFVAITFGPISTSLKAHTSHPLVMYQQLFDYSVVVDNFLNNISTIWGEMIK